MGKSLAVSCISGKKSWYDQTEVDDRKMRTHTTVLFLVMEAVLYMIFMALDLLGFSSWTTGWKYAGILLCLLFSLLCASKGGDRAVPAALLFTSVADLFLLVIDHYYLAGVLFFLAAQLVYLIRLYKMAGKIWLPARLAGILLSCLVPGILHLYSPLNLVSVLYFSFLLVNMAISWTVRTGQGRIFALGLSLFVLCDLCVGMYNLGWIVPGWLHQFIRIGMWLFYLPSQVLISLSGRENMESSL